MASRMRALSRVAGAGRGGRALRNTMQSRWLLNVGEVGHNAHDLASVPPRWSPSELLPATSGHPRNDEDHLMPKRFLSRSARAERPSPCAALADDLREGAARRVPVLLLALERGLHHLHRHVRRQPLERSLRSRVAPEPEDRARNLGDGQRCENEAQHAGQDPRKGAGRGCGRSRGLAPSSFRRGAGGEGPAGLPPDRLERRPRPSGPAARRLLHSSAATQGSPFLGQAPSCPFSASDGADFAGGGRRARLAGHPPRALPGPDGVRRPFELVGVLRLPFGGCGDRFLQVRGRRRSGGAPTPPFLADVRRRPVSTGARSDRRFRLAADGDAGRRDLPRPMLAALPPCAGTANLSSLDTRPALTASVLPDDAIPSAPAPSALTGGSGGAPPDAAGSELRVSLVTSRSPRRLSSACSRRAF